MKKNKNYNFDFTENIVGFFEPNTIPSDQYLEGEDDSILHVIYARDERTGLPKGDLSYYVSGSANPEIKQYILDNLLMDTKAAASSSIPDGLDDDFAFNIGRHHDESRSDYVTRLTDYLNNHVEAVKKWNASVDAAKRQNQTEHE